MASKVEALARNFLKTDAEALYLVPGEKIYLLKQGQKAIVGREALSDESFRAVAAELVPGRRVEALVENRYVTPYQVDDVMLDVLFGSSGTLPAMMMRRAKVATEDPYAGAADATAQALAYDEAPAPEPAYQAPPTPSRAGTASSGGIPTPTSASLAPPPPPPRPVLTVEPATQVEALDAPELITGGIEALTGKRSFARTGASKPVDEYLLKGLELAASDVHLTSDLAPTYRVHGDLARDPAAPAVPGEEVERVVNLVMPERCRKELADKHATSFAYEMEGVARFRVSVSRDRHGLSAVFHAVPVEPIGARDLGLPDPIVKLAEMRRGLVVLTGPAGSGRSTMVAALLEHANQTRADHLVTIEDPIEFVYTSKRALISQREIGTHARTLEEAFASALRDDADILYLGELRDSRSIGMALEAVEAGQLVLGTMRSATSTAAVDRLVDAFPAERQAQARGILADALKGVIAQTLCRRAAGGRVAALEVLLGGGTVATLIRDAKTFQLPSVIQSSRERGMLLLNDSLLDLVRRGFVEPREAWSRAADKQGLLAQIRTSGISLPPDLAHAM